MTQTPRDLKATLAAAEAEGLGPYFPDPVENMRGALARTDLDPQEWAPRLAWAIAVARKRKERGAKPREVIS